MMDKRVVSILFRNGWTQADIARKFNKSRARICQVLSDEDKYITAGHSVCEVCGCNIDKKKYVRVEDAGSFLVCDSCENELVI